MAILSMDDPWVFISGILGNIIAFMVFLAPVPTFYTIVKKKSSQGYESIPYLVALFSCMLWIYYAFVKTNSMPIITINSVGCVLEITYIAIYIAYAPASVRMTTLKILGFFNLGGFSLIAGFSYFFTKGPNRVQLLGWIGLCFGVGVFVAPLSVMRTVIRTKSVEFMPFSLSFFLTLNAVAWFFYGFLKNDFYIYLPNILGFAFGIVQMILYAFYKYCIKVPEEEKQQNAGPNIVLEMPSADSSEIKETNEKFVIHQMNQSTHRELPLSSLVKKIKNCAILKPVS
ncbi:bidirectional sugar transporter NEC1-like [Rhododendron vialii]|uniref:bidirectional sugar transporter NEC1-like n=1 Tax=Rhododendron vialii TaxID=182163 RepID=UPI00265DA86B|nr:bidirectional sugar transporter NEC1-like [Rhododendron vialii]